MSKISNTLTFIGSALSDSEWRKNFVMPTLKWGIATAIAAEIVVLLSMMFPQFIAGWYPQLLTKVTMPKLIYVAIILIPPVVITIYRVLSLAEGYKARYNSYTPYGDHIFSTFMMQGAMQKRLTKGAPERALCQHLAESIPTGIMEELGFRFLLTLPLAMIAVWSPDAYTDGTMTLLTMIGTSIFFVMAHQNTLFEMFYRCALGIIFFIVFIDNGLLVAVLLHVGHNAASSVASYLTKKFEARRLEAGTGVYRL